MDHVKEIMNEHKKYYRNTAVDLKSLNLGEIIDKDEFAKEMTSLKSNMDKLIDINEGVFSIIDAFTIWTTIMNDWKFDFINLIRKIHNDTKRLKKLVTNPTGNQIIDHECIDKLESSLLSMGSYPDEAEGSYNPRIHPPDKRDKYIATLKSTLNLIENYYKKALEDN